MHFFRFDCKKVLDFITAVVQLPRLWQGRTPKLPRHYQPEDMLQLTNDQFRNLLHYVVKELSSVPNVSSHFENVPAMKPAMSMNQQGPASSKMEWTPHGPLANGQGVSAETMEGRMKMRQQLLLDCCQGRYEILVDWLTNAADPDYDR